MNTLFKQLIILILVSVYPLFSAADGVNRQEKISNQAKALVLPVAAINQSPPKYLQKTLQLLSNKNPATKRPVIILFYGQSITEQAWWKVVAKNIQSRFPQADIVFENKAIGAHTSERLVKTAEADVYPLYPDLVIFHVYGNQHDYEAIIKNIRSKTGAEMMIASDHIAKFDDINEETLAGNLSSSGLVNKLHNFFDTSTKKASWSAWDNYVFLPSLSKKYGVELIDVRSKWKEYLRINKISAADLLVDNVHLNARGIALMGEIISAYFKPAFAIEKNDISYEEIFLIGSNLMPDKNHLSATCNGGRFDVLMKTGAPTSGDANQVNVTIDGKLPSSNNQSFGFTRTSPFPNSNWPAILRVVRGPSALIEETWTISIKNANSTLSQFDFDLVGSKTGFDGSGTSEKLFKSISGRVVINPEDWNLAFALSVFKKPLPKDYKITWDSEFHGKDQLKTDVNAASELRVAQDLPKGSHEIELTGSALERVRGIRCFAK